MTDRIRITYWAGPEVTDAIGLSRAIFLKRPGGGHRKVADQTEDLTEWDINGYSTVEVEKI